MDSLNSIFIVGRKDSGIKGPLYRYWLFAEFIFENIYGHNFLVSGGEFFVGDKNP